MFLMFIPEFKSMKQKFFETQCPLIADRQFSKHRCYMVDLVINYQIQCLLKYGLTISVNY